VYGILCLFTLFILIGINYSHRISAAKLNPAYVPNEYVTEEGGYATSGSSAKLPSSSNDITRVANPIAQDSKYYYQPSSHSGQTQSSSKLNSTSKSSFPIAPHGVPSTNPNWTKQFVNNKNY
jgi:hypothetical protein